MNKELPPFKIGDRVVCVDDSGLMADDPVKKGKVCVVKNAESCKCGKHTVDVGTPFGNYIGSICTYCGDISYNNVYLASRFRLIDYSHDVREELAQAAMTDRIETDGVVREIVKN